jgi:glutaredoxin 3
MSATSEAKALEGASAGDSAAAGARANESPRLGEQAGVPVMMYSTAVCPYCVRAESFLRAKGVSAIDKVRVDLEPARRLEMMQKTGRRTVPQIYVGAHHVGGYEDLVALDRAGKLVPLLAGGEPAAT